MASTSRTWGYTDPTGTISVTLPKYMGEVQTVSSEYNQKNGETTVKCINSTAAVGNPEELKFANRKIANVFANSGINPAYFALSKEGKQDLYQINDIYSIERIDDDGNIVSSEKLPVVARLTLEYPVNAEIDETQLNHAVTRLFGSLYDSTGTLRLGKVIRGQVNPNA